LNKFKDYFRAFIGFSVYLVMGILFKKYKREASGTEMIPNRSFWLELPGNIKVFT
jgi:hypothetical protein